MNTMRVHAICISPERGTLKKSVSSARFLTNYGIEGDGHCGNWGRQVTLLNWDSVLASNRELSLSMGPGDFAENLTIEHMENLNVGDCIRIGNDVILQVSQIGKPDHPSVVTRTFGISLLPYEGRFCRVIKGGIVHPGDPVVKLPM